MAESVTEPNPSQALAPLANSTGRVVLRRGKAKPFYGRHPWVLDTAVARVEGEVADGDVVDLLCDKRRFIARGIFNSHSKIRVRLYTWNSGEALDTAFWRGRLAVAGQLREQLGYSDPEGGARLVFSEADGLSGLIVDRYGRHLVVQVNALAIEKRLDLFLELLAEQFQPQSIVVRREHGVAALEGMTPLHESAWGEPPAGPIFIAEHGLRYGVDLSAGQKTGFYLDQRENRRIAARYLRGRRVLDMFCYSGGFGMAAIQLGGAAEVLGVDSSPKAIALAEANAELNHLAGIRFRKQDCFEALDELSLAGERFGGIVLDPPKFTHGRRTVDDALRAYHRINRQAVDLLEPGGILITCSCSGSVIREDFQMMLAGVAQKAGRSIQILEQLGPAPDHPVSASCLDGEYLKCFICRVV
ncbi:MAG: class I SAM-dependent rRNA methyltransferase [Planctomycetales bacterium]|nr:class I SAM-dependent rRNA methyltransferase [Planctomycetales bacterium]